MQAVPDPLGPEQQVSGLGCPDCAGVLNVAAEGPQGTLQFRCRIGHAYAADEVIIGKEKRLEESIWTAVVTLEELAVLLRELIATGKAGSHAGAYEERAARALRHQQMLRQIIADDLSTALDSGADPDGAA